MTSSLSKLRGEASAPWREQSDPAAISLDRIVCATDGSPRGLEASRQASRLARPGARFWAVSVWDPGLATHAGIHAAEVAADLREQSVSALREVEEAIPDAEPLLMRGGPVASILYAISSVEGDLVSFGAPGPLRSAGLLLRSVATALVHHAPCSVLAARPFPADGPPRRIIHANDGSPDSLGAALLAGELAARTDAEVVTVHVGEDDAHGAAICDQAVALIEASGVSAETRAQRGVPYRQISRTAKSLGAGMIVAGSRGTTGVAALGSVSGRLAHSAPCSVLIARRRTADPSSRFSGVASELGEAIPGR